MNITDLKREHFKNGMNFNQADFDAYIAASDKYNRSAGVKSLSCMVGGILLSLLFSGAGGFAGNMLAVAAIFAGLIIGALINAPALKAVNNAAKKLGLTKSDVKEATQHLKNGTTAWQGEPGATGAGASHDEAPSAPNAAQLPVGGAKANFARAQKLLFVLIPIWLVGTLLFLLQPEGLIVSLSALFHLAYAVLAAGIYLLCFAEGKQRSAGVAAAVISFVMRLALGIALIYVYSGRMVEVVTAQLVPSIVRTLLFTGVPVVGALIGKRGNHANPIKRVGFFAAGAFLAYSLINGIVSGGDVVTFLTALFDAAVFAGLYFLTVSLCDEQKPAIRLRGLGLAWCWFAVFGAGAAVVVNIVQPLSTGVGLDAFQVILSGFMLAGYILLLRNRRMGLNIILYGTLIVMSATLLSSIEGLMRHNSQPVTPIYAVAALLNPLFAWLAVRAGEVAATASPVASMAVAAPSPAPDTRPSASPASGVQQKSPTILDKYRAGLAYLNSCGDFDEAKFREFNRITGNRFSEADIQTQLGNASMMIRGMEEVKDALRSTMTEGISTFEKIEQSGIDLSKYNL